MLESEEAIAVSNGEKAELMAKAFVKVHSTDNLSEEGKRRRERTMRGYPLVLARREDTEDVMSAPFTLEEMVRVVGRTKLTFPGKDQICNSMLKNLGEGALRKRGH